MADDKQKQTPDEKKKESRRPPGRFSTQYRENPFGNARSNPSFFADGNSRRRSYAACKNCGSADHDSRSCLERPRSCSPFKAAPSASLLCKNLKATVTSSEVKRTVPTKPGTTRWDFDLDYINPDEKFEASGTIQNQETSWRHDQRQNNKQVSQKLEKEREEEQKEALASYLLAEERKAFEEFIKNLREEDKELEEQQDKPKKDSPGIGYLLMKKMGFKDGKGLGKDEDGMLQPILATKLPKYVGLGHPDQFIEDNLPSKLKGKACIGGRAVTKATKANKRNQRRNRPPPANYGGAAPPQNNMGGAPPNAALARYLLGDEEIASFKQFQNSEEDNELKKEQDKRE